MLLIFNNTAVSQRRTCRPPPLPLQKWPHLILIVYGAQCSESNESVNKIFFRFLFSELSSIFHSIFSEKWHKNGHNSKNKDRRILKFGSTFYSADCGYFKKKKFQKKKKKKFFLFLIWFKKLRKIFFLCFFMLCSPYSFQSGDNRKKWIYFYFRPAHANILVIYLLFYIVWFQKSISIIHCYQIYIR